MSYWMTLTGGEYRAPPQTKDLELVLDTLVDAETRTTVLEAVKNRTDLWVVRAVLGVDLPTPMTFEMLSEYLLETGHGRHTPEVLQDMFSQQIQEVI